MAKLDPGTVQIWGLLSGAGNAYLPPGQGGGGHDGFNVRLAVHILFAQKSFGETHCAYCLTTTILAESCEGVKVLQQMDCDERVNSSRDIVHHDSGAGGK